MRGVFSKKPGVVPYAASGVSQCFHCQADLQALDVLRS